MKSCEELRTDGTVAIIGAGPAGTILARLLQTQGFSVKVFDRDASPTSRSQGGSLDLRKNAGQRAIEQAGLMEEFRRLSRSDAEAFKMLDSQGKPHPAGEAGTHEEAGPEIDRGDLRQMLLGSLAPDTIAWGHAVKEVFPSVLMTNCSISSSVCLPTRAARIKPLDWARLNPIQQSPASRSWG